MTVKRKNAENEKTKKESINWENVNISPEIINLVPYEAAKKYRFVPLEKDGQTLRVGVVEMDDIEVQNALQFLAEKNQISVEMIKVSESEFKSALSAYTSPTFTISKALETISRAETSEEKGKTGEESESEEADKIIREAPVAKIVEVILRNAIEGAASDIHVEPLEDLVRVRYRQDGVLHNSLMLPKKIGPAIVSRVKILSNLKIDERRKPQDGRFRIIEKGKQIDFRVSSLPVSMGEKVVMRVLDKEQGLIGLEDLGIQGRNLEIIKKSIFEPFGMILVTGPTGSGKSTTLYSILQILNKEGVNIVTLEDPVEYAIEGVNQSQVKPEIGYTFANGLRSILRQDPDVIMVGEIRDKETAELGVHAALTGHVVLTTLHTNDSIGAIPRLVDMGVEPFLVASSVRVVVAQRLVRRICKHCKEEDKMPESAKKDIEKALSLISDEHKKQLELPSEIKMYKGKGCPQCGGSGMKGRVALFEVFYMDERVANLLSEKIDEDDLRKAAAEQGMVLMKQDGVVKVIKGITTLSEVERVTEEGYLEIE
ncbi:MAG: hypothetical protein A2359_04725 [Candidatus Moranbacteria bacterium RIFOXYB1_FULL_43_19]|nr:MAG: hypothetical protein A2359_04725 [Candidatus Moranbacteria bacterium RIFOXYB1_FULL_43_19]OGI29029.1 MAG: hypothetical protein A2184_04990 [Candidatus Moranbacteria bacterium RIFOXYA1_FULL_44_7]OGI33909.1 MAG: hypothetical protein A2420_01830 [Candidatus Moranbacteria bacterium RIFOXYC1_FULL_44_13]OGI38042.1 MAG: hypothetical protein A2612_02045 [Candidatus Moranbacteria bacterium RIFOXYD1_FULL_44_12]